MNPLPPLMRDQRKIDVDHLKLLTVFHFVLAGLSVVGLGFLFLHWAMMHAVLDSPDLWKNSKGAPPPKEFFSFLKIFYVFAGSTALLSGAGNLISGLCLHRRVGRTFSIVVAAVNCLGFPFGTALGVFTLVVLFRDSVREVYEAGGTSPT